MRRRCGATAIDIILIVAIICLLVAIAFPWFTRAGRQQAGYDARQTLERLRDAQDAYFAKHHRYATLADSIEYHQPPDVRVSVGGSGLETGRGWNATAQATGATCYIGVGVDTIIGTVHTGDGHVVCP
jgi:Tfp pilus assembly protein PilE